MTKGKKNKSIGILTYCILLIFILGTIGIGYYYFKDETQENPFNPGNSLSTFSVELNETKFKTDNTDAINLNKEENNSFSVSQKFIVSIIPYTNNKDDFAVVVDENKFYRFGKEESYTESFNLECNEKGFTVNISKNTTMYSILKQKYSASRLSIDKDCDTSKIAYFAILIKEDKGKANIVIPFYFDSHYGKDDIQGVEIDKGAIVL